MFKGLKTTGQKLNTQTTKQNPINDCVHFNSGNFNEDTELWHGETPLAVECIGRERLGINFNWVIL